MRNAAHFHSQRCRRRNDNSVLSTNGRQWDLPITTTLTERTLSIPITTYRATISYPMWKHSPIVFTWHCHVCSRECRPHSVGWSRPITTVAQIPKSNRTHRGKWTRLAIVRRCSSCRASPSIRMALCGWWIPEESTHWHKVSNNLAVVCGRCVRTFACSHGIYPQLCAWWMSLARDNFRRQHNNNETIFYAYLNNRGWCSLRSRNKKCVVSFVRHNNDNQAEHTKCTLNSLFEIMRGFFVVFCCWGRH